MRAVVQRVSRAEVRVDDDVVGQIECGLLVLLGVSGDDTDRDVAYIVDKLAGLRIFEDDEGKMNRSVADVRGSVLVVSQFTLYGDCRKGRRPSFISAARPEQANAVYERVVEELRNRGLPVETGRFQAHMDVTLTNEGPVTLLLDSERQF